MYNPNDKKIRLNVSNIIMSKDGAEKRAVENNQSIMYDLDAKKSIIINEKFKSSESKEVKTKPGEKTAGQKRVAEAEQVRQETRAAINAGETKSEKSADSGMGKSLGAVSELLYKLSKMRGNV